MNNEILSGYTGYGMPTPEEEFKRFTGEEFDSNRFEILSDGSDNDYAFDDPYASYTIVERKKDNVSDVNSDVDVENEKINDSVSDEISEAYRIAVESAVYLYNLVEPSDPLERKVYNDEYILESDKMLKALEKLSPEKKKEAEKEIANIINGVKKPEEDRSKECIIKEDDYFMPPSGEIEEAISNYVSGGEIVPVQRTFDDHSPSDFKNNERMGVLKRVVTKFNVLPLIATATACIFSFFGRSSSSIKPEDMNTLNDKISYSVVSLDQDNSGYKKSDVSSDDEKYSIKNIYIKNPNTGVLKSFEYDGETEIGEFINKSAEDFGVDSDELDINITIDGEKSGYINYKDYLSCIKDGEPQFDLVLDKIVSNNQISGELEDGNTIASFIDEYNNTATIDFMRNDGSLYKKGDRVVASNGQKYVIDKLNRSRELVFDRNTKKTIEHEGYTFKLSNFSLKKALASAAISIIGIPLTFRRRKEEEDISELEFNNLVGLDGYGDKDDQERVYYKTWWQGPVYYNEHIQFVPDHEDDAYNSSDDKEKDDLNVHWIR